MEQRKKLGIWGENVARRYLERNGMFCVEQNTRTPYGELDLVMTEGEELVFVEVKTRRTASFGVPEVSVTSQKLVHLGQAIASYLETTGWKGNYRLDVVALRVIGKKVKIQHLRNVGEFL